jgi:opacity protein-like surface antigen
VGLNYKFDPTGAAYAASTDAKSPMLFKTPMLAAWTWAGPYVGGTIGYSAGKSKTDTIFSDPGSGAELFATSASRRLDGAIGGAQAGYNWVTGILLTGVEGDLNNSGQRAKLNAVCPGEICNPSLIGVIGDPSVLAKFEEGQKLEWFATLRARLGVTVTPDAIAYVTGGLAVGEVMTASTVFGFDGEASRVAWPAIGPPRSSTSTSIWERSRPSPRRRRLRQLRQHSTPASPTTSCASASTTSSIPTKSGRINRAKEGGAPPNRPQQMVRLAAQARGRNSIRKAILFPTNQIRPRNQA